MGDEEGDENDCRKHLTEKLKGKEPRIRSGCRSSQMAAAEEEIPKSQAKGCLWCGTRPGNFCCYCGIRLTALPDHVLAGQPHTSTTATAKSINACVCPPADGGIQRSVTFVAVPCYWDPHLSQNSWQWCPPDLCYWVLDASPNGWQGKGGHEE